jgi:two-component system, sensor histidine kinase and response regulator
MISQPILNEFKEPIKIFATIQDITDRKLAEITIRDSEQKLREANLMKDKIFSILHHDFMAPLKTASIILESLENEPGIVDENEYKQIINLVKESNKSIYTLLENLLEWAKSTKSDLLFNPDLNDIKKIVDDCINFVSLNARNKGVNITTLIKEPINAYFDKNMITTVVRNLISNAIKYTWENGEIKIHTEIKNEHLVVSISDNGVGISKANLEKLFSIDKSFSTRGTNNEEGTGLGLVLCSNFVKINKGNIWAESTVGKGTVFSFTLPLTA